MRAGPEKIAAAVARLRSGGVVAFPTETVYGLGADALNERAVARVFELKGRPSINPLIVHVASAELAQGLVARGAWTREAALMSAAFWPGPLSIVLPKGPAIPSNVTSGGTNVAIRCPDHPVARALLEAFGGPLVGPSANLSGRVSPTTAAHVREAFGEELVMVLDGGPCRGGIESTVVSLAGEPRVLRPGLIGASAIAGVIGRPVAEPGEPRQTPGERGPLDSPGQMTSHYAPLTRTVVCPTSDVAKIVSEAGGPAVVISWSGVGAGPARVLPLSPDPASYAAGLYAALREADAIQPTLIVVERPRTQGSDKQLAIWAAVMDRLNRATAGN